MPTSPGEILGLYKVKTLSTVSPSRKDVHRSHWMSLVHHLRSHVAHRDRRISARTDANRGSTCQLIAAAWSSGFEQTPVCVRSIPPPSRRRAYVSDDAGKLENERLDRRRRKMFRVGFACVACAWISPKHELCTEQI
ncbi:hypothetical protein LSAT2_025805 [Lamellibrachia satsuma]|nr:hypothetical protein LSAT2_025805 [Lamellibrachia satsuma]